MSRSKRAVGETGKDHLTAGEATSSVFRQKCKHFHRNPPSPESRLIGAGEGFWVNRRATNCLPLQGKVAEQAAKPPSARTDEVVSPFVKVNDVALY